MKVSIMGEEAEAGDVMDIGSVYDSNKKGSNA